MNIVNITNAYVGFVDSTQNIHISERNTIQIVDDENDNINIILKDLLLSTSGSVLLLSLIGIIIWTTLKPLLS